MNFFEFIFFKFENFLKPFLRNPILFKKFKLFKNFLIMYFENLIFKKKIQKYLL